MLLDTDVLLDAALDRRPHSEASSELLDRVERGVRDFARSPVPATTPRKALAQLF